MKKKGFTLVELLVVVAVIGLLASIVLVSLNTARNRAKATAIKQALAELRVAAEFEYDVDGNYGDVCADGGAGDGTLTQTAGTIWKRIDDSINANGGNTRCNEDNNTTATEYAVWSSLPTGNYWWCVDSEGASKQLASQPPLNTIPCP